LNRSETAQLQGISSKQLAQSANRACPPAGTTRIAAIDSFASPQRRQIKSSPARRASKPNAAIAAGSSINSTHTKLGAVSKAFPGKLADQMEPSLAIPFATPSVNDFGSCTSKPPPVYRWASLNSDAHHSDAHQLAHSSWNRRAWRPARPSVVPGESRTFRAPIALDARSLLAARHRPGWRCPYG